MEPPGLRAPEVTAADVLVVGAGGSGAVVAARLSADPGRRVIVLESGTAWSDDDTEAGRMLRDATSLRASLDLRTSRIYPAELVPGKAWGLARGRAVGGSSAVNAGYFVRAREHDLALWESRIGWSPAAVLDAYRRCETDQDYPGDPQHGHDGLVPVRRPSQRHPVSQSIIEAAVRRGLPFVPDLNAVTVGDGVGPLPLNVTGGQRWDTGRAYLAPARHRPNLAIVTNAHVERIDVRGSNRGGFHATGVAARVEGRPVLFAAPEVVLCAGAIGTAQLLLASGIGPASELEALGLTVVADLPVGRATSDHPQVALPWTPQPEVRTGATARGPLRTVLQAGDVELLPLLKPTAELLGRHPDPGNHATLDLLVADQAPEARGRLSLDPTAPAGATLIRSDYLSCERDRSVLREGIRLAVAILCDMPAVRAVSGPSARELDSDRLLDAWIRARVGTALHLSGTAPAGRVGDPQAVTDPGGRVLGVSGLRVADLSLLPQVPSRGPAATAVMLGELLAQVDAEA